MSAIFGIYNVDGKPVQPSLIEKMSEILSHRGQDDKGIFTDGNIGLGHRMLWTTKESLNEKLPKSIDSNSFVITADARIDNRDELLNQLDLSADSSDKSISDSEIILYSYKKWGEDCTEKLLGDFVFVIWDRQKRKTFCARDHIGIKSFNYYFSKNLFVFGSELKALLCVEEIPRVLNELKVGDYLTANSDDVTSTFYKDIYRLPAGHQMSITESGKHIKAYWSFDPTKELSLSSDEEYAEKFREIFIEAVRCRMRSAYPIGSMLSGGLDSSSVACTARKLMLEGNGNQNKESKLHTFSAVFEKVTKSDESFYINSVLEQGGFEPHLFKADTVSPLEYLDEFIWHIDGPIQAGNFYIIWNLNKLAQSSGVRVMLDGFDGDSTVSHGQRYLLELALSKRWYTFTREAKGYAKNFDESASALIWAFYWRYGLDPLLAKFRLLNPVRRYGKKLYKKAVAKDQRPPISTSQFEHKLNAEFIDKIDLYEHQETTKNFRFRTEKTERNDHYLKISAGVIPFLLECGYQISAPFNIEVRSPFCDKRLVEFCLSLPAHQKMHNGLTRMVMRRAMEGILPKTVQWRKGKSNLSYAFDSGLQIFEHDLIEKTLKTSTQILKEYLNVKSLIEGFERFSQGQATEIDVMHISSSISLALWLQSTEFTK